MNIQYHLRRFWAKRINYFWNFSMTYYFKGIRNSLIFHKYIDNYLEYSGSNCIPQKLDRIQNIKKTIKFLRRFIDIYWKNSLISIMPVLTTVQIPLYNIIMNDCENFSRSLSFSKHLMKCSWITYKVQHVGSLQIISDVGKTKR